MTVDHQRLAAWLQRERDLAHRGVRRGRETAAQTPVTLPFGLDDLDQRLLDILAVHDGPKGICPGVPRLAELLAVSVRTVQRHLADLEAAGYVKRVAVFERADDPEWRRRGEAGIAPRRQTRNTYHLVAPGSRTFDPGLKLSPGPVTRVIHNPQENPGDTVRLVSPLERVSEAEAVSSGPVAPDVLDVGRQRELTRHDQDPSRAEVLAALAPLGPVQVIAEWPNGQPPPRSVRKWRTREEELERRRRQRKRKGTPP